MEATPLYISVDTMEAGPELDMLVAERVMGWRNVYDTCFMGPAEPAANPESDEYTGRGYEGEVWYQLDKQDTSNDYPDRQSVRRHGKAMVRIDRWHPSADLAAAMTLADRWDGALDIARSQSGNWFVRLMDGEVLALTYARTLPLAICRVALKAVLPPPEVDYSEDDED